MWCGGQTGQPGLQTRPPPPRGWGAEASPPSLGLSLSLVKCRNQTELAGVETLGSSYRDSHVWCQ